MTTTKEIGWSYPSSPNAARFGFSKTGCWTVSTKGFKNAIPKAVAGFKTEAEAKTFADSLPFHWEENQTATISPAS